jgi:hypothetical protein
LTDTDAPVIANTTRIPAEGRTAVNTANILIVDDEEFAAARILVFRSGTHVRGVD